MRFVWWFLAGEDGFDVANEIEVDSSVKLLVRQLRDVLNAVAGRVAFEDEFNLFLAVPHRLASKGGLSVFLAMSDAALSKK